jgi:hypothetical protein
MLGGGGGSHNKIFNFYSQTPFLVPASTRQWFGYGNIIKLNILLNY